MHASRGLRAATESTTDILVRRGVGFDGQGCPSYARTLRPAWKNDLCSTESDDPKFSCPTGRCELARHYPFLGNCRFFRLGRRIADSWLLVHGRGHSGLLAGPTRGTPCWSPTISQKCPIGSVAKRPDACGLSGCNCPATKMTSSVPTGSWPKSCTRTGAATASDSNCCQRQFEESIRFVRQQAVAR